MMCAVKDCHKTIENHTQTAMQRGTILLCAVAVPGFVAVTLIGWLL